MHEDGPACFGLSEHFDAVDEVVHRWCKTVCAECPVFDECSSMRDRYLENGVTISGTWAGQLYGRREPRHRSSCGTTTGVILHARHKEYQCDDCCAARREYDRKRSARRRKAAAAR